MGKVFNLPADQFSVEPETKTQPSGLSSWARTTRSGKPKPKREPTRAKTMAASVFNRARAEAQGMDESGDWSACAPRHLLALYDMMHLKTYGFEPSMTSSERHRDVLRAGGFVKRVFNGDFDKTLDYFAWLWSREMGREKWRKENGRDGNRLTFGQSISGMLVDDYRVALTRRR